VLYFLAVVEHKRDVRGGFFDGGGQVQEYRVTRFHVRGAAAVQHVTVAPAGKVTRDGHRVEVAGQQHPRLFVAVSAGQHRIAVARDLESIGLLAQRRLDLVGNQALVARFAGNVYESRGQRDRVATQIQAHEPQG
jgi:hypothetical protein